VRLGSLDEELIRAMDEVGCYTYTLAIESGSDKILKDMDKRLTTAETREKVALLNRMGHKPSAFFIIGFPTERREDVLETLRFAMSLKLRRAHFSIFYPLPGSIEYERLKETGELEELDWSKLKSEKVAFRHKHMSARELRFLQRYAFLRFHLRPRILLTNLWEILNSGNFWFIARRVWVYLVGSGGAGWPGRSSDALRGDAGH
jgi:anaerobic magnesium-protoporphyrin IX monomethyl ester cyclase